MNEVPLFAGTFLLLAAALSSPGGTTGAGEHLVAGATAFREGRYDQALVEFRVAQTLGSEDAGPYAAASLVMLKRPEEAVEAFASSAGARDALLDYYHGLACYEARLYQCAETLLGAVEARSGPRLADQARKTRGSIAAELAKEPAPPSIDWYLARCTEQRDAGRPILAAAYCREAVGLAQRRTDRYRYAEAASQLASLPESRRTGSSR